MTTVASILADWLKEHGYDGLCNDGDTWEGCGCGVDDMCPCDSCSILRCQPAYHWKCEGCWVLGTDAENDSCGYDQGCYRPERQEG